MAIKDNLFEIENVLAKYKAKLLPVVKNRKVEDSKRQKEILEEFNEIETNKPDPVIKTFFEKAKKFWKSS